MYGDTIQSWSLFFAKAYASFISSGISPFVTAPLLFCPGLTYRVLGPKSSISASSALLALEPIPITAITAAVPIIIANVVRNDLTILDLIDEVAEIKDSLKSIIQN